MDVIIAHMKEIKGIFESCPSRYEECLYCKHLAAYRTTALEVALSHAKNGLVPLGLVNITISCERFSESVKRILFGKICPSEVETGTDFWISCPAGRVVDCPAEKI